MKNSRKIVLSVLLIAVILASVFAFASCGKKYGPQMDTAVSFTVSKDVMSDLEGKTLQNYMDALVERKEFSYSGTDSSWGIMLDTINNKKADAAKGEFWFIYCDDEENSSAQYGEVTLKGKKYASANLGASSLPIKEGKTYVFVISITENE